MLPRAVRTALRSRAAKIGFALVLGVLGFALFGPAIAHHAPNANDFSLVREANGAPPGASWQHWFGVDALHRDVFARLAHGARTSLGIAVLATLLATFIGTIVGVTAGYAAANRVRSVDVSLSRTVDVLLALPFLLVITSIGAALGHATPLTVLGVLGLSGWAGIARVVRAKTMQVCALDFIAAARSMGGSASWIVLRHVLPNVAGVIVVMATTSVGQMVLAEAVLGYLSLGVPPPDASWGRMLHEAEPFFASRPALVAAPSIAILITVLGFGRLGDALRDAFEDTPRHARSPGARFPADLLLVAAALLVLFGLPPQRVASPIGESTTATPVRGGTLHVASIVNVRTLDPALAYDESATILGDLLFAKLVTWNDEGQIVGDLAQSFHVSADGLTYSFVLRSNLVFHDGTKLHAADIKRSLERTLPPKTPSPGASRYEIIRGTSDFRSGKASTVEGLRVTGEDTLDVSLERPDATFLSLLTLDFAAPVCPSSGTSVDAARPPKPCGAGPFRLVTWEPDGVIRLERHDGYFIPGRPYLEAIEWLTNERATAQRYKFERGVLDYVRGLGSQDAGLYRANPTWSKQWTSSTALVTNAVFMNTEVAPFDNRAVRRAVALALDPKVLEQVRTDVRAIDRIVPRGIPGTKSTSPLREHNLAAALEQMRLAGFPFDPATGVGGYPHVIDYIAPGDTFEQQAAEVWMQQLARIGLRVRLDLTSYASYLARISKRRSVAMGWAGWKADFPDPSNFFEPTLSSRAIDDEHSQNYAFFKNEELDRLLDDAAREMNSQRRAELFERAEQIIRDEAPWVPTHSPQLFELWQPYVRGYVPHPILPQRFRNVWLDEHARKQAQQRTAMGPSSVLLPFGLVRGQP
jgi:ABC-type dipeptide/oligopeptide/nickel transport system permease subunit/ABC-type transport system substrate-binding protein